MTQLGWHLQYDTFDDNTPYGLKTFTNIIATQNPSMLHRLTLACHFDSKLFHQFEFIGATDSAVPCALLIDIARHLNNAFQSVRIYLLFVLLITVVPGCVCRIYFLYYKITTTTSKCTVIFHFLAFFLDLFHPRHVCRT